MKQKLIQFMYGRYGTDELNMVLLIAGVILSIISSIIGYAHIVGVLFSVVSLCALVLVCYRTFSKNKFKRNRELIKYMSIKNKVVGFLSKLRNRISQSKTHRFFRCPNCKTTVRVPKNKGKINIHCPKCSCSFIRKT